MPPQDITPRIRRTHLALFVKDLFASTPCCCVKMCQW